jgi:hypothetical protein
VLGGGTGEAAERVAAGCQVGEDGEAKLVEAA